MKVSHNWLSQYIDISFSDTELVEKLTMAGVEVEDVIKTSIPNGVIVAENVRQAQARCFGPVDRGAEFAQAALAMAALRRKLTP